MVLETRQERGQAIANLPNQIQRISQDNYQVKSQSGNGEYTVSLKEFGWVCSCPDHVYRHVKCKHIFAVEFSTQLRREVETRRIQPIINATQCVYCESLDIVKAGLRHNKHGDIQLFQCKTCGRYFSFNIGFEKMKHNPQAITTAMQLYFSGESLRNTQRSLRIMGVEVSHQTVYNWIKKYTKLLEEYADNIQPNVGDTWRADELWVKVKGDLKYVFALMDDETRYWIAQEVADTKHKHIATGLFKKGREVAGKKPKTLITDGLPSYNKAYTKEFWTARKITRTKHIRHIHLAGDMNNNKMERLNGEIRDREKVMRGLKSKDTPIIAGYQIFHNYIRGHEGLDGKTPAEACGIKVEGKNKWTTLIQNASNRDPITRKVRPKG